MKSLFRKWQSEYRSVFLMKPKKKWEIYVAIRDKYEKTAEKLFVLLQQFALSFGFERMIYLFNPEMTEISVAPGNTQIKLTFQREGAKKMFLEIPFLKKQLEKIYNKCIVE